ncbi:MAG: hypothetical protein JST21_13090 [Bacteroidetes bacterium]|nr:hypothetical protein [Bacteroidota bacterium]
MAYTPDNHIKRKQAIKAIYDSEKHHDIPDTFIVTRVFPKHNIYISYRTWMNIKHNFSETRKNERQLSLFA